MILIFTMAPLVVTQANFTFTSPLVLIISCMTQQFKEAFLTKIVLLLLV